MGAVILIIVFVAVIAAVMYVQYEAAQQRHAEWCRVASSLGLHMSEPDYSAVLPALWGSCKDQSLMLITYPHPAFHKGHSLHAPNIMTGRYAGTSVMCFDLQYRTGSGKHSQTHYFLCLLLPSGVSFPQLCLRPESIGDRFLGLFGVRDLQLESEAFDRAYHVTCDDSAFALEVLHPQMRELLQSRRMCVEAVGRDVLLYHSRQNEGEAGLENNIRELLDFGRHFMAVLPRHFADSSTSDNPC